ncbi:MAG: SIMPL domain-containing protein [Phycisphaerales bacterium]|nr:SIMPL domain-containing protein [Phycisphaerales bacterium]MCB9862281.1 SIMPL domain-containing protein [Phycisphaerales bacterium]
MRIAMLSLIVTAFVAQSVRASDQALPHVSVYGTAVTQVAPDLLRWSLRVSNKGADLQKVAEAHAATMSNLLVFLKEKGIKEEKTQTTDMCFEENWEYRDNSRVMNGYIAITYVSFEMTDLNAYRNMWISLAGMKYVSISDVSLDVSTRIQVQNETRKKALLAAREKAAAMAQTLGAEIGEPLAIEEIQDAFGIWNAMSNSVAYDEAPGGGEKGTPLSLGQIPVEVRVKVEFRIVANG